jgi:hypothetical protein
MRIGPFRTSSTGQFLTAPVDACTGDIRRFKEFVRKNVRFSLI